MARNFLPRHIFTSPLAINLRRAVTQYGKRQRRPLTQFTGSIRTHSSSSDPYDLKTYLKCNEDNYKVPNVITEFTAMKDGTKKEYELMAELYADVSNARRQSQRVLWLLKQLDHPETGVSVGAQVNLYEHSLQSATRAFRDGADEEVVVAALLHDIGELLSPSSHGDIAAGILLPFVTPRTWWILAHHEVFQGYYYFHHLGGDKNKRDIYQKEPFYQDCIAFCEKYDQASFDPSYDSMELKEFIPMVERVFARTPFAAYKDHPKKFAVTGSLKH